MMPLLLLTRSERQNQKLSEAIGDRQLKIHSLPLLEAKEIPEDQAIRARILELDQYDAIIFISKNAVLFGLPQLERYWPQWPMNLRWLAVGPGTASILETYDIHARYPETASSEGLLAMPDLGIAENDKILIVRGLGGRETLKAGLSQRGAAVDYLEVYERQPLKYRREDLPTGSIMIALIYSGEAMAHLADMLGSHKENYHLIVPSKRLQELAIDTGFVKVEEANSQEDNAMIEALMRVLEQVDE